MSKLRVLLVAESCNPEWVSVPLVGWSQARAIARQTDAHLVTQVRNDLAMRRAGLRERVDYTAIDSEQIARPLWYLSSLLRGGAGKGWTTVTALRSLPTYYFDLLVWKHFGRRITRGEFDVVHRLTPVSPTIPSPLATLCRGHCPFVLGPLNGGVPWPRPFDRARRQEREWLSYLRGAYKLLPGYHTTRRDAAGILIGSRDTWNQMPRQYHDKCFYMPENGIDPARFGARRTRKASRPLRVVFVGRLVPYKGADMLIEAAAPLMHSGDVELDIIGDGPQMNELRDLASSFSLHPSSSSSNGRLTFSGWVQHDKLQTRLVEADVFAFPSIREFGGGVVLEAMAVGLVPIVVNYGGPAELVTPATGLLLRMETRESIIAQLREVLSRLAREPNRVDRLSDQARRRAATQFDWDVKAAQVVEIYQWLLGQRDCRPVCPMPIPDVVSTEVDGSAS